MTSFVLIPGAGGAAWYWHRVIPLLQAAGHDAVAVDLPGDDERFGLQAYAELVVRALEGRSRVVLVAQSMGGFTAPLVCRHREVAMLVFLNAMIPVPNETPGAWWGNTRSPEARRIAAEQRGYSVDFDLATYFFHDLPDELVRAGAAHAREEGQAAFAETCRFDAWPAIPIHVLVGKDDRFFPSEFQERVARERLHKEVETIEGGHLAGLSNPEGVAERLLAYAKELDRAGARVGPNRE